MSGNPYIDAIRAGRVDDCLIRELTDPDSPEFEGRCHCERCQQARSIALMAMTGVKPHTREELEALRAHLRPYLEGEVPE